MDNATTLPPDEPAKSQVNPPRAADPQATGRAFFKRLALLTALFSLTVGVFMTVTYSQSRLANFLDSEALAKLKQERLDAEDSTEVKTRIRDLDKTLRQDYFKRLDRMEYGALLLLGGISLFIISMKITKSLTPQAHMPPEAPPPSLSRRASFSRLSLGGLGILLGAAAWLLPPLAPDILSKEAAPLASDTTPKEAAWPPPPTPEMIQANWPSFRGPGGSGRAPFAKLPTTWNLETGDNIIFKTPIPSKPKDEPGVFLSGENSPVIWADRLFFTGADEHTQKVYCFDAGTGECLWQSALQDVQRQNAKPPEVMQDSYFAVPTAATDGRHVYAIFANGDVAAFDFKGRQAWAVNLGLPDNHYCHATSLVVYQDNLLVQMDQATEEDGKSILIGLDCKTGKTRWTVRRPVGGSWSSPILINAHGRDQLITTALPWVIAHDPADGRIIWQADCMDGEITPSPVFADDIVYAVQDMAYLTALKTDGKGDVTKTHITWKAEDGLPDVCSPITNGKYIFMTTSDGLLTCVSAADGKMVWEKELNMGFQASPSIVGDMLILVTAKGKVIIIKIGDAYQEIAQNDLGEKINASPAFYKNRMYIRGTKNLFCIGLPGDGYHGDSSASNTTPKEAAWPPPPTPEMIQTNWPSFRGPGGSGRAPFAELPTTWDVKAGKNSIFKTPIPSKPKDGPGTFLSGENSPVLWADRLFFTGADEHTQKVYCFDAGTGECLWQSALQDIKRRNTKPPEVMQDSYFAVPTAATDGRHVYAIFANGDVAAFDFKGRQAWAVNLGLPDNHYCHASSLVVHQDNLLVQMDQANEEDGKSILIGLDCKTGKTRWTVKRPVGGSWSSPILINAHGRDQLITTALPWVIAHDPADGGIIWQADCMDGEITPSPVFADNMVYAVQDMAYLTALKTDGKGDVTKTHITWKAEDGLPDVCSPITNGKYIFMTTSDGLLTCVSAADGKMVWEKELNMGFQASPSIVGDMLILVAAKGKVIIIKIGDAYQEIAQNDLGEKVNASPAFYKNRMYIRGTKHLFCIGTPGDESN